MNKNRILALCGVGGLLAIFATGVYIVPKVQAGDPSTARQSDAARVPLSDVYVDVTYATPDFVRRVKLEPYLERWRNRAQPFLLGINTHVGTIADLDLAGKILLEDSRGQRFPSLGAPVVLTEHHNMYLLVFPLVDNYGKPIFSPDRERFRLIVQGVGHTPERVFEWKLPVVETMSTRTLASLLMVALGAIGSLMVILSPCAIELTSYYTGIIAGIVGTAGTAHSGSSGAGTTRFPRHLRGRILRNLAAFVGGFTILYMASGATVALLGSQLLAMQASMERQAESKDEYCTVTDGAAAEPEKPRSGHAGHAAVLGGWTRYANWIGAGFLVYFALRAAGVLNRGGVCLVWLATAGRRLRLGIAALVGIFSPRRAAVVRAPVLAMRAHGITPTNSFCAGLGLSVSCLTCMGGAILYPLLIFVGTSTWYWGALILGTYSVALAGPMAAIAVAVGNYAWQSRSRPRLIRGLQWTAALVMITVAFLIAFDRTRFVNSVVFTVLSSFGAPPAYVPGAS